MDMKAFVEGLKELARVMILAVVSFALTEGVVALIVSKTGVVTDPEIKMVIIGLLTSVLRSIDKFMHETGKAIEKASMNKKGIVTETSVLTDGLVRF